MRKNRNTVSASEVYGLLPQEIQTLVSPVETITCARTRGVYALKNGAMTIYVGMTEHFLHRVGEHRKYYEFDSVLFWPILGGDREAMRTLEAYVIKILDPILNVVRPKKRIAIPVKPSNCKRMTTEERIRKYWNPAALTNPQ